MAGEPTEQQAIDDFVEAVRSGRRHAWLNTILGFVAIAVVGVLVFGAVTTSDKRSDKVEKKAVQAKTGANKAAGQADEAQKRSKHLVRYLQGKEGKPGIGKAGAPGKQGGIGRTGPRGFSGHVGINGGVGATGEKGATGDTGGQGPAGETGAQGTSGETGATGGQGDQGPQGPQGDQGPQGAQGDTGPAGPTIPCAEQPPELGYVCLP